MSDRKLSLIGVIVMIVMLPALFTSSRILKGSLLPSSVDDHLQHVASSIDPTNAGRTPGLIIRYIIRTLPALRLAMRSDANSTVFQELDFNSDSVITREDTRALIEYIRTLIRCGNGAIDTGEVCDDKNSVNLDGCSNICQVEADVGGDPSYFDFMAITGGSSSSFSSSSSSTTSYESSSISMSSSTETTDPSSSTSSVTEEDETADFPPWFMDAMRLNIRASSLEPTSVSPGDRHVVLYRFTARATYMPVALTSLSFVVDGADPGEIFESVGLHVTTSGDATAEMAVSHFSASQTGGIPINGEGAYALDIGSPSFESLDDNTRITSDGWVTFELIGDIRPSAPLREITIQLRTDYPLWISAVADVSEAPYNTTLDVSDPLHPTIIQHSRETYPLINPAYDGVCRALFPDPLEPERMMEGCTMNVENPQTSHTLSIHD